MRRGTFAAGSQAVFRSMFQLMTVCSAGSVGIIHGNAACTVPLLAPIGAQASGIAVTGVTLRRLCAMQNQKSYNQERSSNSGAAIAYVRHSSVTPCDSSYSFG